jgi:hypothetical protein
MEDSEYFLKEDDNDPNKKWFVLNGTWKDSYKSIIKINGIKLLRIADSLDYDELFRDLSFLKDLSFLEGLEIYCDQKVDLSPLYSLRSLKRLALVDCDFTGQFDLSHFQIIDLSLTYSKQFIGLKSQGKLEKLFIEKISNEIFDEICFDRLSYLKLYNSKILDLNPLQDASLLNQLDIYNCPILSSINSLESCLKLNILEIEKCKSIYEITALKGHPSLRQFRLEGCGDVKTLRPLLSCSKLKGVSFNGKGITIEDGDFTDFMSMDSLFDFRFQNKRTYKPKFQDFEEWAWKKFKVYLDKEDVLEWKVIHVRNGEATFHIPDSPFFGIAKGQFKLNDRIRCRVNTYSDNKSVVLELA